jgi:hypothetical protein
MRSRDATRRHDNVTPAATDTTITITTALCLFDARINNPTCKNEHRTTSTAPGLIVISVTTTTAASGSPRTTA